MSEKVLTEKKHTSVQVRNGIKKELKLSNQRIKCNVTRKTKGKDSVRYNV